MKKSTCQFILTIMLFATAAVLSGCDQQGRGDHPNADAVASVMPTKGHAAKGIVTFSKVKDGVRVIADFTDLSPGAHGIHIHEFGDCRAEDGSSAGGHFNPHGKAHGAPDSQERHVGDLGNIIADENGVATLDVVDPLLALEGEDAILGRSVIVHSGEDDYKTQPHGGAGERVACGTIGIARQ